MNRDILLGTKTVQSKLLASGLATNATSDKQRFVGAQTTREDELRRDALMSPLQKRMQEALLKADDSYGF
ncbi:hypothetical protein [Pseudomonas viridiflava]|uniref:hypothetical protein n=1 Tax=Pseudomonas viridiflava TaxID=33069 RepID=UPI000F01F94F|nr:hypothetical protein [Pseudomonas viridiflava]